MRAFESASTKPWELQLAEVAESCHRQLHDWRPDPELSGGR